MTKDILRYGVLAGLIVGLPLFGLAMTIGDGPPSTWGMAIGFATMLVAFSLIFVAVKRRRDVEGGGVIRFWPALGLGLGISAVASLFWVGAWELAMGLTGTDFAAMWSKQMIADATAKGASAADLAKLRAEMAAFAANYANPAYRMAISFSEIFPIGCVISVLAAAVLRNPRIWPARRLEQANLA